VGCVRCISVVVWCVRSGVRGGVDGTEGRLWGVIGRRARDVGEI